MMRVQVASGGERRQELSTGLEERMMRGAATEEGAEAGNKALKPEPERMRLKERLQVE
jgi:hypothetical protein